MEPLLACSETIEKAGGCQTVWVAGKFGELVEAEGCRPSCGLSTICGEPLVLWVHWSWRSGSEVGGEGEEGKNSKKGMIEARGN